MLLGWTISSGPGYAGRIEPGPGQQTANINGTPLALYTYGPRCSDPKILVVLHGLNRNADGYRTYARSIADRACMLVVAPKFDSERFPSWRFQRGGIVDRRGVVQPASEWTGNLVIGLVGWVRQQEGRHLAYSMIGHSAGGQFLSRIAAFNPNDAGRMVVANPSTYVFPTLKVRAAYGLGGVYPDRDAEAQLRRYLAAPVTIFLGQDDVDDENRNDGPEALAQGETRYDRGRNAYAAAKSEAQARGWPMNWRLVELPGVGHSARKMFSSQQALDALAP
jgi:poly(3-hydroxybutyrate) depolymerase